MSSYLYDLNEAKKELQEIVSDLNAARARLSNLIEKLPERGRGPEMLVELRLSAREVRNDLLKDSITILQAAINMASGTDEEGAGDDDQRRS